MSALMFVVTGFVVWLIEHRINEEFQGHPAQQIGTLLWFAASTLVYAHSFQSGHPLYLGQAESNPNFGEDNCKRYLSPGDYYEALSRGSKNGGVAAIVDEIPYLKLFLGTYPHGYTMIKTTITTNGFGFAFQKGSPLVHEISRSIAELREEGKLLEMENKWFRSEPSPTCLETKLLDTNTLGIESFSGLFLALLSHKMANTIDGLLNFRCCKTK